MLTTKPDTKMAHTPGPWVSSVNGIGMVIVRALGFDTYDGSVVLATTSRSEYVSYEGEKANARLIAAAPELLAALDHIGGLSSALRQGGPDPMDLQGLSDALTEAVDLANSLVARATGAA